VDDESAGQTADFAAMYDAIYASRDDVGFWRSVAAGSGGPILELGCGTGRVLLPLARAGFEVTGLDLSSVMLARCRAKLEVESPEVRGRVALVQADMTSFDLGRRFAAITCPFGGFQQLRTVKQQLACLDRCRSHLLPGGTLVLDLPNPDPAPAAYAGEQAADGEETAELVDWTGGRRIRWWVTVTGYERAEQWNECEMTFEVHEPGGATRQLIEKISLRYIFRYELEHLLIRAGFRMVALHGDYDRSPFGDASPAMIAAAQSTQDSGGEHAGR